MAKKKNKSVKNESPVIKKAGIRFDQKTYVEIEANMDDFSSSIIVSNIDGTTTEYELGGGGATIEPLEVTTNGTYEAPTGTAYNPVTVNVGDEYEEITIWTNPDPSKGLKVDTQIATTEYFEEQNIEYIKIIYREINNRPDRQSELTLTWAQLSQDYAGALVSSGDYNQEIDRREYYVRPVFFDGNWGGVYFLGQCREVSTLATDKNFRAVPEVVYGYKLKEV